MLVSGRTDARD